MTKDKLNITITETIILEETEELREEEPLNDSLNVDESAEDVNENSAALTQKLLDYIEALKFNPSVTPPDNPTPQNDTDTLVTELLGGKKMNKKGDKSKSKVKFTTRKIPSGFEQTFGIDPSLILNGQTPPPIGPGKKIKKKSYTKIIREWGRRPMLIESEAPWTLRNRIYSNAVQAMSGNTGQNQTNFPYVIQQPLTKNFGTNYYSNSSWLPPNAYPGTNLKFPPVLSDAAPIITGISGLPGAPDGVPTAVAVESPYTFQEFVVPVSPLAQQRQQQVLYNGNSQVSWVPIIPQQQQLITYVDRHSYDEYIQEIPFMTQAN